LSHIQMMTLVLLAAACLMSSCQRPGFRTLTESQGVGSSDQASGGAPIPRPISGGPPSGYLDTVNVGLGFSAALSKAVDPYLPQEDRDCLSRSDRRACVFRNSPVFQTNRILGSAVVKESDLTAYQTWSVPVVDLGGMGEFLENSYISVSWDGTADKRARAVGGSWKFPFNSVTNAESQLQVHVYVFLTGIRKLLFEKSGFFPEFSTPVRVRVYDSNVRNNAKFTFSDTSIALGFSPRGSGNYPMAIDADIALHEYGHALLHQASQGKDTANIELVTCSDSSTAVCCPSVSGCMGAIHEGQADFLVALMTPGDTRMATSWLNSLTGLRNVSGDKNLTINNIGSRQFHTLGRIYASVWYEIYKQEKFSDEIVALFLEHLELLEGKDNFLMAKQKILQADRVFFAGKYSRTIEQKFRDRGL
jgi:hypothetical protein